MKIALVVIRGALGGPKVYGEQLVRALLRHGGGHDYVVLTDDASDWDMAQQVPVVEVGGGSPLRRVVSDHLRVPSALRRWNVDVVHHTRNVLPALPAGVAGIVTIHDAAPFMYPATFTRVQGAYLRHSMRQAAARANRVITVSEASRQNLGGALGIPIEHISAVHPGVGQQFFHAPTLNRMEAVQQRYGLGQHNVMIVGTLQPRKNVEVVVKALRLLIDQHAVPHDLVLVGRAGWKYQQIFDEVAALGLQDRVRWLGSVPEEELPVFYHMAEALVAVSTHEGFGLTVVEAMASGVPVIVSETPTSIEVAGEAACRLQRVTPETVADAMWRLIMDDRQRKWQVRCGRERASQYSWDRCAKCILSIYETTVNEASSSWSNGREQTCVSSRS